MGIDCYVNEMGKGKTMCATLKAKKYARLHPDNIIYSNYTLNLPNAIYTPYLIIPYNNLKKCMLIADDFFNLKNLDSFMSVIVSLSRKKDIDIILTSQYYTMIPPLIRQLSDLYKVKFSKEYNILQVKQIFKNGLSKEYYVKNAIDKVKDIYDTNECVKFITDTNILEEIKRLCIDPKDIELNLNFFFRNQAKIIKYRQILGCPSSIIEKKKVK